MSGLLSPACYLAQGGGRLIAAAHGRCRNIRFNFTDRPDRIKQPDPSTRGKA